MKATTNKPLSCDAPWSEHQASLAMARTIKQNRQDDVRAANRESDKKEADRKQSVNMQFWRRVWVSCNVLLLLIVAYGLFQFFTR